MGRSAALALKNEIAPRVPFVRLSAALDERDFHPTHGREVYGPRIAAPNDFLVEQRAPRARLASSLVVVLK